MGLSLNDVIAYAKDSKAFDRAEIMRALVERHGANACIADLGPADDREKGLLDGIMNGSFLDAQTFPPLRYTVERVLPEGFALLVGPPKIGKSWMVLQIALAAAAGGFALGHIPVTQRPVLYLALEDGPRRLQDRCRALLCGDPIPHGFEYVTTMLPDQTIPLIGAWLDKHPCGFAILDTLGKVMPQTLAGETPYSRDYRIGSALKLLADDHIGSTVAVNHHDRKAGSDDFIDSVSGTHGLAGAADTVIVIDRKRNESNGLLRVTGRDVMEGEYALTFKHAVWTLDGACLDAAAAKAVMARMTAGVGDRMADVIEFVNDQAEGARAATVAAHLGLSEHMARTYLDRAEDAGRIRRVARGLYIGVASVASVAVMDKSNATDATHATPILIQQTNDSVSGLSVQLFAEGRRQGFPALSWPNADGGSDGWAGGESAWRNRTQRADETELIAAMTALAPKP